MPRVCAYAPGKIIWFGEHFVVLGKPAIASAVDVYAKTCIESSNRIIIESKNLGIKYSGEEEPGPLKPLLKITEIVGKIKPVKGFHAVIDSNIPVASGMGSSAAVSVSFTAALLKHLGIDYSRELVSRIAFEAEKIVHGKPSGIDNTISTYGGFIVYQKNKGFRRIRVKWPEDYILLVADTGIERSTKVAVEKVLDLYRRRTRIMKKVYDVAGILVKEAIKALRKGDVKLLGDLMNINHGLLVSIGVAIPETEVIVHKATRSGALGAKITGAGLGGSVIILCHIKKAPQIVSIIEEHVKRILYVRPVSKGVRVKIE